MLVQRTPFVGAAEKVQSPVNPEVEFGIKRVGNREVMAHRDKNASIRYIQREGSDEYISEKDYPVGTLRVDTVALCLESWNIADAQGNPVKIDKESILSYLDPEELDFLNDKALEINPILAGRQLKKTTRTMPSPSTSSLAGRSLA